MFTLARKRPLISCQQFVQFTKITCLSQLINAVVYSVITASSDARGTTASL